MTCHTKLEAGNWVRYRDTDVLQCPLSIGVWSLKFSHRDTRFPLVLFTVIVMLWEVAYIQLLVMNKNSKQFNQMNILTLLPSINVKIEDFVLCYIFSLLYFFVTFKRNQ